MHKVDPDEPTVLDIAVPGLEAVVERDNHTKHQEDVLCELRDVCTANPNPEQERCNKQNVQ